MAITAIAPASSRRRPMTRRARARWLETFTHDRNYTIEIAHRVESLGPGAPAIGYRGLT
jgi:hypothetical protein